MTEKTPEFAEIGYQPSNLKASIEELDADERSMYIYHWDVTIKTSKVCVLDILHNYGWNKRYVFLDIVHNFGWNKQSNWHFQNTD